MSTGLAIPTVPPMIRPVSAVETGPDLRVDLEARVRELEASREQYRQLLETSNAVPWEYDLLTARCTYMGPQAVALLGYAPERWSKPGFLFSVVHPDDRARCRGELERLRVYKPSEIDVEYRFVAADGRHLDLRSRITVVKQKTRVLLRMVSFDVTTRKLLEAQLANAQKLESVGRLAAGVAHEINTPVQYLGDSLSFLSDAGRDLLELLAKYKTALANSGSPAIIKEMMAAEQAIDLDYLAENLPRSIESATDGVKRVATIVRSLSGFANPDALDKAPADVNQALERAVVMASGQSAPVAEVKTELQPLPPLMCHVGELGQAFSNIIVNAVQSVGEVAKGSRTRGLVTIRSRREGEMVVISISDTGTGITESVRPRIFDPFFTTRPVGSGTGQGLAIAHTVVNKHRGTISVDTTVGQGSTFTIRLPLEPEEKVAGVA